MIKLGIKQEPTEAPPVEPDDDETISHPTLRIEVPEGATDLFECPSEGVATIKFRRKSLSIGDDYNDDSAGCITLEVQGIEFKGRMSPDMNKDAGQALKEYMAEQDEDDEDDE